MLSQEVSRLEPLVRAFDKNTTVLASTHVRAADHCLLLLRAHPVDNPATPREQPEEVSTNADSLVRVQLSNGEISTAATMPENKATGEFAQLVASNKLTVVLYQRCDEEADVTAHAFDTRGVLLRSTRVAACCATVCPQTGLVLLVGTAHVSRVMLNGEVEPMDGWVPPPVMPHRLVVVYTNQGLYNDHGREPVVLYTNQGREYRSTVLRYNPHRAQTISKVLERRVRKKGNRSIPMSSAAILNPKATSQAVDDCWTNQAAKKSALAIAAAVPQGLIHEISLDPCGNLLVAATSRSGAYRTVVYLFQRDKIKGQDYVAKYNLRIKNHFCMTAACGVGVLVSSSVGVWRIRTSVCNPVLGCLVEEEAGAVRTRSRSGSNCSSASSTKSAGSDCEEELIMNPGGSNEEEAGLARNSSWPYNCTRSRRGSNYNRRSSASSTKSAGSGKEEELIAIQEADNQKQNITPWNEWQNDLERVRTAFASSC